MPESSASPTPASKPPGTGAAQRYPKHGYRRRYFLDGLTTWPENPLAHTQWTAIRCKDVATLTKLYNAIHFSSRYFLCPKERQGTTLFMPTMAWRETRSDFLQGELGAKIVEETEVRRKEHMHPNFLPRFGKPGHSKLHAWYQCHFKAPRGASENRYSSTFLLDGIVEVEAIAAALDFEKTIAREKHEQ